MKRFPTIALLAVVTIAVSSAQQSPDHVRPLPGDRPAASTHATRSVVMARNGMIATSQPLASAAGPEGAAGRRQRHRRRRHRGRGPRRRRAVDDRHRRRSVRDCLRREDQDAARAQRQRPIGVRRHARRVYAKRGQTRMPGAGVLAVTVPGVVDGWSELLVEVRHACRWRRRSRRRSATRRTAIRCRRSSAASGRRARRSSRPIRRRRRRSCPTATRRSPATSSPTRTSPRRWRLIGQGRPRRVLQGRRSRAQSSPT